MPDQAALVFQQERRLVLRLDGVVFSRRADRLHPRRTAKKPPVKIQPVYRLVDQGPAALARPGRPPRGAAIVGHGAIPRGVDPSHPHQPPQRRRRQQLAKARPRRLHALLEHHAVSQPRIRRPRRAPRRRHRPRLGEPVRHRFLHQHMFARRQRPNHQRRVRGVGRRDQHRLHLGIVQHGLRRRMRPRPAPLRAHRRLRRVTPRHRDHSRPREGLQPAQMLRPDQARPHQTVAHLAQRPRARVISRGRLRRRRGVHFRSNAARAAAAIVATGTARPVQISKARAPW